MDCVSLFVRKGMSCRRKEGRKGKEGQGRGECERVSSEGWLMENKGEWGIGPCASGVYQWVRPFLNPIGSEWVGDRLWLVVVPGGCIEGWG